MSEEKEVPKIGFAARSKSGVKFYRGPQSKADKSVNVVDGLCLQSTNVTDMQYSDDGSLFLVVDAEEGVHVYSTQKEEKLMTIERKKVFATYVSPNNSYLLTWERFSNELNDNKNNLIVWDLKTGEQCQAFTQKAFDKDLWPTVQWSPDESLAGRMVSNEVQFFAGDDLSKIVDRVKLDGISQFSFSPRKSAPTIAVFSPEAKGKAACCRVFSYPDCKKATASKSFYQAMEVKFRWNAAGTYLLLSTHTEVDKTGKSYYGVDGLHFLAADGSRSLTVPLPDCNGSIHDVSWAPEGQRFTVIYGKMPTRSTMFDLKGTPVAEFGQYARNTLAYAPSGRLLMIGGFGNLQGAMDLWDPRKLKKIGEATAHCSAVQTWSPNSRFLLTAVTSPRIRVDNGWKIFYYDGSEVETEAFEELYDVQWQPALRNVFPNQPLSPRVYQRAKELTDAATEGSATGSSGSKAGAYVPPGRRAAGGTSSVTAQLRGTTQKGPSRYTNEQRAKLRTTAELEASGGTAAGSSGQLPVGAQSQQQTAKQRKLAKLKAKNKAAAAAKRKQKAKAKPAVAFEIEEIDFGE